MINMFFVPESETFLIVTILVNKSSAFVTQLSFLFQIRLNMGKNRDLGERVGRFLGFDQDTIILLPNEVHSVLSTPCKPFFYMLSINFWGLCQIWQNLDFVSISLPFYV